MEAKLVVSDVLEAVYPNIADGKVSLALEDSPPVPRLFPYYLSCLTLQSHMAWVVIRLGKQFNQIAVNVRLAIVVRPKKNP